MSSHSQLTAILTAARALRREGPRDEWREVVQEMRERVIAARSYDEAVAIIREYVDDEYDPAREASP